MRSDISFSGLVVSALLVEEEMMVGKYGGTPCTLRGHAVGAEPS
jgi:hypothetical protein